MKKKIWNIAACFFAFILSAVLVTSCVAIPFYYSITALTEPETVAAVIQNVDYKSAVEKSPAVKSNLKRYGISPDSADKLMKSEKTSELIEIYADEASEILTDIPENTQIDVALVKKIVSQNTDKAISIAEKKLNVNFKEKEVKKNINNFIKTNEKQIEKSLPVLENTRVMLRNIKSSRFLEKTISLKSAMILISSAALIMVVIILLRKREFGGFLWVSIDFVVITLILIGIIIFSKSRFINLTALSFSDFGVSIIESAVSVCTKRLISAVFISGALAVLFMAFYITLRAVKHKYQSQYIRLDCIPTTEQEKIDGAENITENN